jgi:hypothetical protein
MKSVTVLLLLLVQLVACTIESRANGMCCIREAAAVDVHFEPTLTCFTRDSASFLVNIGAGPLVVTEILIASTCGDFGIKVPPVPDTLNIGETLRVPVAYSPSSPDSCTATITFKVFSLDGSSKVGEYISNLSGNGYIHEVNAYIERDYLVFPGSIVSTRILVDDIPGEAYIDKLSFSITFDSAVMALWNVPVDKIYSMFAGTLLGGWSMTVTSLGGTTFAVDCIAPPERYLSGEGTLLNLEFLAGYGNGKSSEIAVEITAVNRSCVIFKTVSGLVTLVSVVPLGLTLEPNVAANNQITMFLVAAEPASITAQVFASNGELIETLIDHQAYPAGRYTSTISTEGLAAGTYTLVVSNEQQQLIERFVVLR